MKNHSFNQRKQNGAVLFVSLVILVIMTLIGITGMQTTILEEKMSGNFKDKTLAFQAAESALKSGESFIQTTTYLPGFNGLTPGLYKPTTGTLPPQWDVNVVDWSDATKVAVDPVAFTSLAQQPAFILEQLDIPVGGSLKMNNSILAIRSYRVTARGVGATINSPVMVQSVYNKFE